MGRVRRGRQGPPHPSRPAGEHRRREFRLAVQGRRDSRLGDRSSERFAEILERTARRYFGRERGDAMVATFTTPGVVLRIEGEVRAWDYADEA